MFKRRVTDVKTMGARNRVLVPQLPEAAVAHTKAAEPDQRAIGNSRWRYKRFIAGSEGVPLRRPGALLNRGNMILVSEMGDNRLGLAPEFVETGAEWEGDERLSAGGARSVVSTYIAGNSDMTRNPVEGDEFAPGS